jgi:hypothetical protein
MVAGTAYLISMTGADKAEHKAVRDSVLSFKKAALGSAGMEVTTPSNSVARSRGEGRVRTIFASAEQDDEDGDGFACPPCTGDEDGDLEFVGTVEGLLGVDAYCLACCTDQIIKLDVVSEKLGAPTDVTVTVKDSDGIPIFGDDDGRGLGGTSLDACVIFRCPEDGNYSVEVGNIAAGGASEAASGYVLRVDVLCNLEVEPNDPGTEGNFNCPEAAADEEADEDGDGTGPVSYEGVGLSGAVSGEFGNGDIDCWTVCLNAGDVLNVAVDSSECDDVLNAVVSDAKLTLDNENGIEVAVDDDTFDLDPGLVYHAEATGPYTLCLEDVGGFSGVYDLSWFIEAASESDSINCPEVADEDVDVDEDSDL